VVKNRNKDECLFQKPGGNMKLFRLGIIIIFFFATAASLSADKVYTWTDNAKEYIDTHDRNQYMRRAHKYEMKKKASEADAAIDQANAAAEKARKAAEKAKRAEEELKIIHN
jgi:hypothetical protein